MFPVEVQIGTRRICFLVAVTTTTNISITFHWLDNFHFRPVLQDLTLTNQIMPQTVVPRTTNIVDVVYVAFIYLCDRPVKIRF
jgi:hypothetical protein